MGVTTAAIIASFAAAVMGLSPSWSFASTITITDKGTAWYTISAPFLTTITTDVSGTVETITTTKVSISIGTEPPSAIPPAISTGSPTFLVADSASRAVVREVHGIEARSPLKSKKEVITLTHSHAQSSTIEDSDILHTVSIITDQSDPTTATSSTTTRPTTSVIYHTSRASNRPCTSSSIPSKDSTTTFGSSTITPFDTASATSSCDYETVTSIPPVLIPTSAMPASWITGDFSTTCNEDTTFTTRTVTTSTTSSETSTLSNNIMWSSSTCLDGESWTDPSPFTHPTPTDNTPYNPAWQWVRDMEPTDSLAPDGYPPGPHPTLPFEHPATLYRAQWIARLN